VSSVVEHRQRRADNLTFLRKIREWPDDERRRDWEIAVIYYATLHAVDMVLANQGIDPVDHTDRKSAMRNQYNFKQAKVGGFYADLELLSRDARYECHLEMTDEDVAEAEAHAARVVAVVRGMFKDLPM
jgi:uncharacterized protein (UPF0332 family)